MSEQRREYAVVFPEGGRMSDGQVYQVATREETAELMADCVRRVLSEPIEWPKRPFEKGSAEEEKDEQSNGEK